MKRVIAITLCILTVFALTACGKASHSLDPSYDGEVQATDGRTNYIAEVKSGEDGVSVTLRAPDSVAGLCCEFSGGELHTRLNGLDCITVADSLPPASFVSLLHEVFLNADSAEYLETADGVDTFSLKTRGGTAVITAKDGKIQSITAEYGGWTIDFS